MKWLEISVQCDGEAAEAVAELFNRFNSSPGQTQGGAVVEIGGCEVSDRLVVFERGCGVFRRCCGCCAMM